MDLGITGKVAVVTGGSVGIGLGVAEALAREGAHVVLAARDREQVEREAVRVATAHGVEALGVGCDIATAEGAEHLGAAVPTSLSTMRGDRLERDHHGGARRQLAELLGVARDGGGPACPRHRADDARARRR